MGLKNVRVDLMKRAITPIPRDEILREFPIEDPSAPGWYFREREVSNGYYMAEGRDADGRVVGRNGGPTPLRDAIADAVQILNGELATADIELDARSWKTAMDFYDALLPRLGTPSWHGRNVNALVDSMVCGGVNLLQPPYVVRILHSEDAAPSARDEILAASSLVAQIRAQRRSRTGEDVSVAIEVIPTKSR